MRIHHAGTKQDKFKSLFLFSQIIQLAARDFQVFIAYLPVLVNVCEHDDDVGILFPYHPPKFSNCASHRALGRDVSSRRSETVHVISVDILVAFCPA